MPTYNAGAVSDTAIAYQKPITLQQGRGLRDNPLAIAEMSSGAPVMAGTWHPYNMTVAGTGDGEIWSFSADGAVSAIETPDFAEGWEYRLELIDVANSAGAADITFAAYYQTSAAYSSKAVLRSLPPSPSRQLSSGYIDILRAHEAISTHALPFVIGGSNATVVRVAGTQTDPPLATGDNAGAVFVTHSTAQRIGKARLSISTGTMNGGKVLLMRRKLYG